MIDGEGHGQQHLPLLASMHNRVADILIVYEES